MSSRRPDSTVAGAGGHLLCPVGPGLPGTFEWWGRRVGRTMKGTQDKGPR